MLLEGRVALITDAARGIGKASAMILAQEGADVGVVDILPDVEETGREISRLGKRAAWASFDISDPSQVAEGVGKIRAELGDIDVLVNNANQVEELWVWLTA